MEDSSSTGIPDEVLRNHRFKVYEKDTEAVHRIRVKILGLGDKEKPLQEDIDSSPIFKLRRAIEDSSTPSIIGQHWIPYLQEKGILTDCPPQDILFSEGGLPLYTRDGVLQHVSNLEQVLNKEKSSILIAVVLPKMQFNTDQEFILPKVHKSECLNQASVHVDAHVRKQIAFCPYCGVMNENSSTGCSHARKHLGLAYLCGGCYTKIYKRPQALYLHRQACQATLIAQRGKDPQ